MIDYMEIKKMIPEMIANDIFLFKNIISEENCQYILETIEKYPAWEEATTIGQLENYRKTKVDYLVNRYGSNSELYKAHSIIGYHFKLSFESLMNEYKKNENETYLFYTGDEGVQILKYEPGEFYHEHIDNGPMTKRIHSSIIFLNNEVKMIIKTA